MRICQVFSRRGFNIDSLVVSEGRDPNFSRMTIDVSGDPEGLEQIIKQVSKLIDVIHAYEHKEANAVQREMLLLKINTTGSERSEVLQVIEHFACKTVDFTPTSIIAMATGTTSKIDAMMTAIAPYNIVETVRTGKVVMARGEQPT